MNLEEYNKKQEELVAQLTNLRKQGQEVFETEVKTIFEKHPFLKEFSWTQYTPFFNDGDKCVFSAHVDDIGINGQDEYGDGSRNGMEPDPETYTPEEELPTLPPYPQRQYGNWRARVEDASNMDSVYNKQVDEYDRISALRDAQWFRPGMEEKVKAARADILTFMNNLSQDDFKAMFGDHACVLVHPDEIVIDSYEHA